MGRARDSRHHHRRRARRAAGGVVAQASVRPARTFAGVGLLLVVLDGYVIWDVKTCSDVNDLPTTRYLGSGVRRHGDGGQQLRHWPPGWSAAGLRGHAGRAADIPLLLAEYEPDTAGVVADRHRGGRPEPGHPVAGGSPGRLERFRLAGGPPGHRRGDEQGTAWLIAVGNAGTALAQASTVAGVELGAGAATLAAAGRSDPGGPTDTGAVGPHWSRRPSSRWRSRRSASRHWPSVRPGHVLALMPAWSAPWWPCCCGYSGRFTCRTPVPGRLRRHGVGGGDLVRGPARIRRLEAASETIRHAFPLWRAELTVEHGVDWQTVGRAGAGHHGPARDRPGRQPAAAARSTVAVAAVVLAVLILPAAIAVPWWFASIVDIVVAAVLLLLAIATPVDDAVGTVVDAAAPNTLDEEASEPVATAVSDPGASRGVRAGTGRTGAGEFRPYWPAWPGPKPPPSSWPCCPWPASGPRSARRYSGAAGRRHRRGSASADRRCWAVWPRPPAAVGLGHWSRPTCCPGGPPA